MKKIVSSCLLIVGISVSGALKDMPSGEYGLDDTHGYVNFTYSHFGFSNPYVGFSKFSVVVNLDGDNPANSVLEVEIDVNSIDSRVEIFNEHLLGEEYFDVEKFPTIKFASKGIKFVGENQAEITGDLTIKGVTKSVVLDATLNKAAIHPLKKIPTLGVSARTQVKRSDWGLSVAVPFVSDAVDILIEVELPQTVN